MTEDERIAALRHSLADPLSAILAEAQLLLAGDALLDEETRSGLQRVEALAFRMRAMLKEAVGQGRSPKPAPGGETR
jgi:signal transduction histidine kinase